MFRLTIVGLIVLAGLSVRPLLAAPDPALGTPAAEIVVYEARTSPYSHHFRSSILPLIRPMAAERRLPVRFVDVLETASDGAGLSGAIRVVPTLVLFRDGREDGRIAGLYGVTEYQRLLADLLSDSLGGRD